MKKKRKIEDINTGDDVLIYFNTRKTSKEASLKPRFKGPYTVQHAKKKLQSKFYLATIHKMIICKIRSNALNHW